MQHEDAEQVEDDVQDGGQQQEVERGLAVAQCSDETGEQVIKESERNTDEDDQKIEVGTMQDVVRRLHHEQDSLAKQGSDDGQHNGNDEGNPKTVGYVTPQVAV